VNRRRPGDLYQGNITNLLQTQEEKPATPAAGSDGKSRDSVIFFPFCATLENVSK
jgi:hypothetical protein